jgi:hypothetical protein
VAFRSEMNDGTRAVLLEQRGDQRGVADVTVGEDVIGIVLKRSEIGGIARVGQLVQVDHFGGRLRSGSKPIQDKVRADESGTAGDENAILH